MKAFVAGATGGIGRRLVAELTDRGHEVVGLTRDEAGDRVVERHGGVPHRGDLFDPGSLREGTREADVAIRVATAVPTGGKTVADDWATNDRLRREGTENLLSAAVETGTDRYLQESVVWVARQPDGSTFDEYSPPNPDRTTRAALDAERTAAEYAADHYLRVGTLRLGWLYAHDGVQTRAIARALLAGRLPVIGGGPLGRRDAELSVLHDDDAARAFAAAAEADRSAFEGEASGTDREGVALWHVVDDSPVTAATFLRDLADRLGADPPRRVPWWLARPLAGKDAVRFFTSPFPTTSDRFREAVGWHPVVPDHETGLDRVVDRWHEASILQATDDGPRWAGEA